MALTDNLLGSWHFNNDFTDSSGNGYDLTNHGITFDAATPFLGSGSGVFNGSNAWGEAPGIDGTLINGSLSGAIWINLNSFTAFDTFMSVGVAAAGLHGFSLDTSNTNNGLRIFIYGNTGGVATITVANALLGEEGNWVLVGFTLDIVADLLTLYKDGLPIASLVTLVEGLENDAVGLNIGNLKSVRYMDGKADAAVLINGAWSDADHLEYYNGGVGLEIPVAVAAGGQKPAGMFGLSKLGLR